jgi:hypothetical protein
MKKNYITPAVLITDLRTSGSVLYSMSADPTLTTEDNFSRYRNRRIWDDEEEDENEWY